MGTKRDTKNRFTLYRTCGVCGKEFSTTADTPFVRAMPNPDWSHVKTVYFCSESCKESTYKYNLDGLTWKRREERERKRDTKEKNFKCYHAHEEEMRERRKRAYHAMTPEEREKENAWRRMKHAANREEDNRKRREKYRQKKEAMRKQKEMVNRFADEIIKNEMRNAMRMIKRRMKNVKINNN